MQDTIESVKFDLDEDEIRRLIDAIDHYEAYLHSQQRDETKFRELLVRLRKMLGKPRGHGSE
jgi:DNA gyrase/topoisomerase IV subunit A